MDKLTPGQEALAEDAATAIVDAAKALHPGDPVRQAACALNAAMHLTAIWPEQGEITPVLYPGTKRYPRTPAETEEAIAGVRHPYGSESR